jgi:hypothetical protein
MAIDASIALGVKPVQLESPINMMSNVYALQNAQQSNQLNQLNLGEAQRKIEDRNRLRETLGGFGANMTADAQVNALARAGFLEEAKALAESTAKVGKEKREAANFDIDTVKKTGDVLDAELKRSQAALVNVNTPQGYIAWHESNHKNPVIGPYLARMGVTQDTARADIETKLALPGGLDELKRQSALGVEKNIEMSKPNMVERTDGARKWLEDTNPYSPTFKQKVSAANMKATPGEIMSRDTQIRGQDLTNARELQRIEIEKGKNSPEYIAMKSKMEEQGKGQAKFEAAAPQAITTAEQLLTSIDDLVGKPAIKDKKGKVIKEGTGAHKGFSAAVGAESMFPTMPGSQASNFEARLDQIKGGAFLESFEILRGGGSITEKEGDKGTAARMRMTLAQSEEEFIAAARDYQDVIRAGIKAAKEKLAKGSKTLPTTTPAGATVSNWHD